MRTTRENHRGRAVAGRRWFTLKGYAREASRLTDACHHLAVYSLLPQECERLY